MSNLRLRLTLLNFLQFAVWGCYLISLGGYLMSSLGYSGLEVGAMYGTMGIASLFMPALVGIIADKYVNAERLLALCHMLSAAFLVGMSMTADYGTAYLLFLGANLFYMPTIALTNTICYSLMSRSRLDIASTFPKIRVWGTVGFIAAMWTVGLCGWAASPVQLYVSAVLSLVLSVLAITLPPSPPSRSEGKKSLSSMLGLDALVLFKNYNMSIFFVFSMLLGAALQITNTFGTPFLSSFSAEYADSLAVRYPTILLSLSQISETLFILSIPFFLNRFGIKMVMLMSMLAWVLRFGLFGIGNPGDGFVFLVLSMIVYGMAFDFFNVSGSMFVDREVDPSMRGSAQGLFMMMTNGVGAILGGLGSGYVVDFFKNGMGQTEWSPVWFTFASYALIIMLLFAVLFRYKEPRATS
ncbi:MAG: nucleoside permease [Porphyromonadaceae bacterium]|nr:nucleoside permease [Porphyromonadaceae bacterium]